PVIAKPDLISWLEEEEKLLVRGCEEEEGLAGGVWETTYERKVMAKEDTYSTVKENVEYCNSLRMKDGKHPLKGRNNYSLLKDASHEIPVLDPSF
ncbi:UNVERIFIED_CONTAM: hypothetical protein K2H54_063370, partial [Gekko kuhli]